MLALIDPQCGGVMMLYRGRTRPHPTQQILWENFAHATTGRQIVGSDAARCDNCGRDLDTGQGIDLPPLETWREVDVEFLD